MHSARGLGADLGTTQLKTVDGQTGWANMEVAMCLHPGYLGLLQLNRYMAPAAHDVPEGPLFTLSRRGGMTGYRPLFDLECFLFQIVSYQPNHYRLSGLSEEWKNLQQFGFLVPRGIILERCEH